MFWGASIEESIKNIVAAARGPLIIVFLLQPATAITISIQILSVTPSHYQEVTFQYILYMPIRHKCVK